MKIKLLHPWMNNGVEYPAGTELEVSDNAGSFLIMHYRAKEVKPVEAETVKPIEAETIKPVESKPAPKGERSSSKKKK